MALDTVKLLADAQKALSPEEHSQVTKKVEEYNKKVAATVQPKTSPTMHRDLRFKEDVFTQKADIQYWKDELESSKKTIDGHKDKKSKLSKKRHDLQSDLRKARNERGYTIPFSKEAKSVNDRIKSIKQSLKDLDEQETSLQETMEKAQKHQDDIKYTIAQMTGEIDSKTTERDTAGKELAQIQDSITRQTKILEQRKSFIEFMSKVDPNDPSIQYQMLKTYFDSIKSKPVQISLANPLEPIPQNIMQAMFYMKRVQAFEQGKKTIVGFASHMQTRFRDVSGKMQTIVEEARSHFNTYQPLLPGNSPIALPAGNAPALPPAPEIDGSERQ